MMSARHPCPLEIPEQHELHDLVRAGVHTHWLFKPVPVQVAVGTVAHDGLFEHHPEGERWFALEEPEIDDIIFWNRSSGRLRAWSGQAFALGQSIIDNPVTYSFDCNLNIFADPVDWLRAKRDGIVVLPNKWPLAFDRLRDAPRIAIAEGLLPLYRRHMKPNRLPELMIIPERRHAA